MELQASALAAAADWREGEYQFLQANLAEALGILGDETLRANLRPLLYAAELQTLEEATALLEQLQSRLAYTHKIEEQVGRAWHRAHGQHELERVGIIDRLLPLEVCPGNYVGIIEWYVAIATHFPVYIKKKPYYSIDDFECDLVSLHKSDRETALKTLLQECRATIHEALRECLWDYREVPREADLQAVISLHHSQWRQRLCFQGRLMVDAVKAELAAINIAC